MVISLVDISKRAESPTMHQRPVLAACLEKMPNIFSQVVVKMVIYIPWDRIRKKSPTQQIRATKKTGIHKMNPSESPRTGWYPPPIIFATNSFILLSKKKTRHESNLKRYISSKTFFWHEKYSSWKPTIPFDQSWQLMDQKSHSD